MWSLWYKTNTISSILFNLPNFFSEKLMRKNSRKIKIKRVQKIWNIICSSCLHLWYSLFRIFFINVFRVVYCIWLPSQFLTFITYLYKNILHLLFLLVICAYVLTNVRIFIKSNWIRFCFNDFKQRVPKDICFEKPWSTPMFMKQRSDMRLHVILCSRAYFFSKLSFRFADYLIMSYYAP